MLIVKECTNNNIPFLRFEFDNVIKRKIRHTKVNPNFIIRLTKVHIYNGRVDGG